MYKNIKIIYDSALDEYLEKLLKKHEIVKYVKMPDIQACWSDMIKHLNTHVWPGTDTIMLVLLESEIAKSFIEDLKKLKEKVDINFNVLISTVDELI
jgi:hypothetical protein